MKAICIFASVHEMRNAENHVFKRRTELRDSNPRSNPQELTITVTLPAGLKTLPQEIVSSLSGLKKIEYLDDKPTEKKGVAA